MINEVTNRRPQACLPILLASLLIAPGTLHSATAAADLQLPKISGARPRNIIFILTDDQRYDALGFLGHPFLETPNMDWLARGGVHCRNAFVTTSLCSPSRASILTGLYAHTHRVVDNYNPVGADLVFFPQHLQRAGYETAFIGKWHRGGERDDPQRGFDHWVSFNGQGSYWADGHGTTRVVPQPSRDGFNVGGRRVPQRGYITDELTDYALDWLNAPPQVQGKSFLALTRGKNIPWRDALLYEYFWERNYPQTPTMHAVRGDRYKYIRCQGIWDTDELYDLQADPEETRNLIRDPVQQERVKAMNQRLFDSLAQTGGTTMPLLRDLSETFPLRKPDGSQQAEFPGEFFAPR